MRCPTHLCSGQEAVAAAIGCLLKKNDYEMLVETEHIISSDKSYFICQIDLKAFLNNQLFYKKNWNEKIARKWQ